MQCKICNKNFDHLGSHLWHKHKVLARDYKIEFELPLNYALVTPEIQLKQREANARNYDTVVRINLIEKGKPNAFKPGVKQKRTYISAQSMKKNIATIINYNKTRKQEACPVCKLITRHMPSHLYNKHNLISSI